MLIIDNQILGTTPAPPLSNSSSPTKVMKGSAVEELSFEEIGGGNNELD